MSRECPSSPDGKHQPHWDTGRCIWCGYKAEVAKVSQSNPGFDFKRAFKGETLDGHVEAARVRPLDAFSHEAVRGHKLKVREMVSALLVDEMNADKEYAEAVEEAGKAELYGVAVILEDIRRDEEKHRYKLKTLMDTVKWDEI